MVQGMQPRKSSTVKKLNRQIISDHMLLSPKYLKYHSRLLKSLVQTEILNSNLINQSLLDHRWDAPGDRGTAFD